jgi:hypothetical protein
MGYRDTVFSQPKGTIFSGNFISYKYFHSFAKNVIKEKVLNFMLSFKNYKVNNLPDFKFCSLSELAKSGQFTFRTR